MKRVFPRAQEPPQGCEGHSERRQSRAVWPFSAAGEPLIHSQFPNFNKLTRLQPHSGTFLCSWVTIITTTTLACI